MTDQLSEIREYSIAEIEAMLADVTPGQWSVVGEELRYVNGDLYAVIQTPHAAIDFIAPGVMEDHHMGNARLAAHAPSIIRYLLAQLEAAKQEKDIGKWATLDAAQEEHRREVGTLHAQLATAEKKLGESEQRVVGLTLELAGLRVKPIVDKEKESEQWPQL